MPRSLSQVIKTATHSTKLFLWEGEREVRFKNILTKDLEETTKDIWYNNRS